MPPTLAGMPLPTAPTPTRLHPLQWAMAASAWLSTLSAQLGHTTAYAIFKPLTMLLAMACVAAVARGRPRTATFWLLMAGLLLSMLGDVFLLNMERFLPGLVAFLLAHVCYIALFRRDAPWLASKAALALCVAAGVAAYAYLYRHGLPAAMQWPVAVYVAVIGLMASQALGRAQVLRTPAAWCVAGGAVSFMASDTVLAVNRFAWAVPCSQLWVLGTYYLAQWLIVHGMLQVLRDDLQKSSK